MCINDEDQSHDYISFDVEVTVRASILKFRPTLKQHQSDVRHGLVYLEPWRLVSAITICPRLVVLHSSHRVWSRGLEPVVLARDRYHSSALRGGELRSGPTVLICGIWVIQDWLGGRRGSNPVLLHPHALELPLQYLNLVVLRRDVVLEALDVLGRTSVLGDRWLELAGAFPGEQDMLD